MKAIVNHGLLPRRYLVEKDMLFGDVAVKNTYSTEKFVYICIKRALAEFNNFKILISIGVQGVQTRLKRNVRFESK